VLDVIGLSTVEQAVYETLVARASATADELRAVTPGLPVHADVDAALDRLVTLGLVTRQPSRYVPVPPADALEALFLARERELVAARARVAALDERFEQAGPGSGDPAAIEVVHGVRQSKARFFDIQRDAPSQVHGMERPPYFAVVNDPERRVIKLIDSGLRYRLIYDPRALEVPGRSYAEILDVSDGRRVRIGEAPVKMVLTDEPVAMLPLHDDVRRRTAMIVVHDPTLLAALLALFDLYWARAMPVGVRPGLHAWDRTLLPLLVAGLTDREIAAKLDWSHRTVRRRVRDLMERLDARTRFQAGFAAVRRGWLADG
jgi:DNA-binding CsgD family transcriptional regulator/sugar-specific transcriptional regulator TrmB